MENTKTSVKQTRIESYDIAKSDETLHLATDLAKFIKENKLYQNIQGKDYVNVEGWQYAGSRLGVLPIIDQVVNISTDVELKYQAKVNLINLRTYQIIGAGFAVCSNKEQGKKYYQEFAIASMAQTRAIGKAYRNILAWIITAAGYCPTPAEEVDYTNELQAKEEPAPTAPTLTELVTIKYATAKQKEEIIRLLNNPAITRQEKTKYLLNINKFSEEQAAEKIGKIKKVIKDREEESSLAA